MFDDRFLLYQLLFIAITIITPIVWLTCPTVRYFVRIGIYYFMIFFSGQVSFFLVMPYYGDVTNYRTIRWLFLALTPFYNIKWELRGGENLISDLPYVVIANHQSSLDLLGLITIWPDRCVAIIKSSMKYIGLLGLSAMACGSVFIERYNKEKAIEAISDAVDQIKTKRVKVWMFPEGTRNHGPGMLPFKKGAFHLAIQGQIPIVPIVFSRYSCFYSRNERRFASDGYVIVQAMPPISVEGLTAENVTELSETCRQKMLAVYDQISIEAAEKFETGQF